MGESSFLSYEYGKSSIKPPGAYLLLRLPEGGLLEGVLFTKSSDKGNNFTAQMHKFDTVFIKTILELTW